MRIQYNIEFSTKEKRDRFRKLIKIIAGELDSKIPDALIKVLEKYIKGNEK